MTCKERPCSIQAWIHPPASRAAKQAKACLADIVQHIASRNLLRAIHAQAVEVLDLHVRTHILALVGLARRQPLGEILVALGLVDVVRDGEQLRPSQTAFESANEEHAWPRGVPYWLANA